jgi:pimeloyl-ACP methyl ester carboxylesterase
MAASPGPAGPAASTGTVTSADGTGIGVYQLGQGPAVILLHGAGQSGADLRRLADGLADAFTVYVPDRPGRGRSGLYRRRDGLSAAVEDLSARLEATGARRVSARARGRDGCRSRGSIRSWTAGGAPVFSASTTVNRAGVSYG